MRTLFLHALITVILTGCVTTSPNSTMVNPIDSSENVLLATSEDFSNQGNTLVMGCIPRSIGKITNVNFALLRDDGHADITGDVMNHQQGNYWGFIFSINDELVEKTLFTVFLESQGNIITQKLSFVEKGKLVNPSTFGEIMSKGCHALADQSASPVH